MQSDAVPGCAPMQWTDSDGESMKSVSSLLADSAVSTYLRHGQASGTPLGTPRSAVERLVGRREAPCGHHVERHEEGGRQGQRTGDEPHGRSGGGGGCGSAGAEHRGNMPWGEKWGGEMAAPVIGFDHFWPALPIAFAAVAKRALVLRGERGASEEARAGALGPWTRSRYLLPTWQGGARRGKQQGGFRQVHGMGVGAAGRRTVSSELLEKSQSPQYPEKMM